MMKRRLRLFLSGQSWLLVLLLSGMPMATASDSALDQLLLLVDGRLQLMKDVAAYKFVNNISVENKQREQLVLASAISNAQHKQLNRESVESFFRLQIQLAKTVQSGWIEQWRAKGRDPSLDGPVVELSAEIRQKLISLGEQIVSKIPMALPELHDSTQFEHNLARVERGISSPFVSIAMKHQLLHALILIHAESRPTTNVLADILRVGVLRVGTTGDYQPFSFIDSATGNYAGIDIDLAANLANHLGVELKLVETSWPTLMDDLAVGRFDIGMGGISRTLLRQRHGFFSAAYFAGGKTGIGRCAMAGQLDSLDKIDQPDIRVIVNPGGTNEKYVRQHIRRAQVIVHADNRMIFSQIVNNKADVMITDDIEVRLQHRLHPQLCATMPGVLLTRSEKGFLLPQDIILKEYVDAWLRQLVKSGKLQAYFDRYLGEQK